MRRPWISISLAACVGLWIGCYNERLPPPTFRYPCGVDEDCRTTDGEQCVEGLCQIPCTAATFDEDCPTDGNYALCFNGTCGSTCQVGEGQCPSSQSCVLLPIELPSGGGGFFSFGGGGDEDVMLGVCGVECEAGGDDCPTGETCLFGFCVSTCESDADCGFGLVCASGVCTPAELADTGDSGADASDTTSDSTGATSNPTTDATTDASTGGNTTGGTQ